MKPHPCFRVEFQVTTKEKQLFTHETPMTKIKIWTHKEMIIG